MTRLIVYCPSCRHCVRALDPEAAFAALEDHVRYVHVQLPDGVSTSRD